MCQVMRKSRIPLGLLAALAAAHGLWACEMDTVRGAAFSWERDEYRLCVFGNRGDGAADAILHQLASWTKSTGPGLNMRLERVYADDPDVPWQERYGIPSAPLSMPVVALIGGRGAPREAFVIDHWEPGPTEEEWRGLTISPVREALKGSVVGHWAVVLVAYPERAEGASESERQRAEAVLVKVQEEWGAQHPPGIQVISFSRRDPEERLLCRFAGIDPDGRAPWAGVAFGRGRMLAPPLEGAELTEANLLGLLEALVAACTCLQESVRMGMDLPLVWDDTLDAEVADLGIVEVPESAGLAHEDQAASLEEEAARAGAGIGVWAPVWLALGLCGVVAAGAVVLSLKRRRA